MIKPNKTIYYNSAQELNLPQENELKEESLFNLYNHSIDFVKAKNKLPCNPAPEKHPYKETLPLDKSFQKFIIGTFPPHTYQADIFKDLKHCCSGKKVSKPKLPFYHGNREMLWFYLLGEELFNSLSPAEITNCTVDYTLDPRLGIYHVHVLKEHFLRNYGFKASHSRLYEDLDRDAINLS